MSYTEAELAGLTAEERAAITELSPEEQAALNKIVGDGSDDDADESGDDDGDEGDDDSDSDADANDKGDHSTDEAGKKVELDESKREFVPVYHADPVEDFDGKMLDLQTKFEAGDIELKDYNAARDSLVSSKLKAEISAEQNSQFQEQLWHRQISDHLADNAAFYTTGNKLLDSARFNALDTAVRDLGSSDDNADKNGTWFLREAHKLVTEAFGVSQQSAAKPVTTPAARKPDLSDAPVTLSKVPAAADNVEAGEFAHLDKLNSIDYERALARMGDDQRARFLAM